MTEVGNTVPESPCEIHPTTRTTKRAKRSSKAVRQRKRMSRRVMLNKFTQERVQRSFKIDIVEIDGVECDFADAFAFFTWYQENYVRLDDIPKPLALKFRDQYLALNVSPEEDEWLRETILHKFLFDECYYEKLVNSDSDESVFDEVHKTDHISVDDDEPVQSPRAESPIYRADSPVYIACDTTDYSGSDEASNCTASSSATPTDRIAPIPTTPIPEVDNSESMGDGMTDYLQQSHTAKVLYKDLGARRLCEQMTAEDFKDINKRKKQLVKRCPVSNVKIRYGIMTLYLKVDNIRCYHRNDDDPILVIDNRAWDVRQDTFVKDPSIIVRPIHQDIVRVVAMG